MDGPRGYNIRYQDAPGAPVVGLRVTPNKSYNAYQVMEALISAGMFRVEVWRSGERLTAWIARNLNG
jgi:hypothetical protein